jgi:quinol monooxygenase YgiN
MVQARFTIFADPDRREELVRSIRSLIESARLDSACVDCRLLADVADPNAITLVEEWSTRSSMERRMRSAAYGRLMQLLELSCRPPEARFHAIAESSGLEAIERIRLADGYGTTAADGV